MEIKGKVGNGRREHTYSFYDVSTYWPYYPSIVNITSLRAECFFGDHSLMNVPGFLSLEGILLTMIWSANQSFYPTS